MNLYTIYWKFGKKEELCGISLAGALNSSGYGNEAISDLQYFSNNKDRINFKWNNTEKKWERVKQ